MNFDYDYLNNCATENSSTYIKDVADEDGGKIYISGDDAVNLHKELPKEPSRWYLS